MRDHLSAWLARCRWDWFGHLTFRACRSDAFAERAVNRWLNAVSRKAWGAKYYRRAGEGAWCFAGFERQKRGDWHAHALIGGTCGVPSIVGKDLWDRTDASGRPVAIARVWPYRPVGGAEGYCTKYVVKDSYDTGFWRLLGNWDTFPLLSQAAPSAVNDG